MPTLDQLEPPFKENSTVIGPLLPEPNFATATFTSTEVCALASKTGDVNIEPVAVKLAYPPPAVANVTDV